MVIRLELLLTSVKPNDKVGALILFAGDKLDKQGLQELLFINAKL